MNLKTNYIGKEIFFYEEIDSTQKEIWRRISNKKIKNGTLIITRNQTNGVGTHGRIWHTDENNIIFSVALFPKCKIEQLNNFTLEIADIIVEIFKDLHNIDLDIKKPNDIMINNKKIGGILTESRLYGEYVKELVIGIGINTNQQIFEEAIREIATSIKNEFDIVIDNFEIVTEFCNRFEKILKKRINMNN